MRLFLISVMAVIALNALSGSHGRASTSDAMAKEAGRVNAEYVVVLETDEQEQLGRGRSTTIDWHCLSNANGEIAIVPKEMCDVDPRLPTMADRRASPFFPSGR